MAHKYFVRVYFTTEAGRQGSTDSVSLTEAAADALADEYRRMGHGVHVMQGEPVRWPTEVPTTTTKAAKAA